ncbi:MAG TPA: hypothetical protein VNL71_00405 [Chloroflexota bacterium]|nr:hypothetical protein [Chloroflexota bacterium]
MTVKRLPRPRDPIQLGKLMVDIATGQVVDAMDDGKDAGAAAMAGVTGKLWELADLVKVLEDWEAKGPTE